MSPVFCGDDERRRGDGHRRRDPVLARQGLVEHAIDQPSEVPLGRVDELVPDDVRRRVVQDDGEIDDELPPGVDDRDVVEREHIADVRERVRDRRAVVEPRGGVAQVGEIGTRGGEVEVVRDRDAVQVVQRPLEVDDRAGRRIEQDGDDQPPGERDADGGHGRARRVLLVDLLDRDQDVLAALIERAGRAVDEPELVLVTGVARHVAREHDVVEDDQQPPEGAVEAEVAGHRVGRGVVLDPAIAVDVDLGGRDGVIDESVDGAAGIGDAIDRQRLGGRTQEQGGEGHQQEDCFPARPRSDGIADLHDPRSTHPVISSPQGGERGRPRCEPDSGSPAVVGPPSGPVRPVTLRRHLSMALPFSKSRQIRCAVFRILPGFTPPAGSRSGTKSSRPALPSRRN